MPMHTTTFWAAAALSLAASSAVAAPKVNAFARMEEERDRAIPGDSRTFRDVTLRILSPQENEVLPSGDVVVAFALAHYELPGAAPGPSIQVIIDNQPGIADFDATRPLELKGLANGAHTVRAFPARPWHESIKAPRAFAMVHFFVGERPEKKPYSNWPTAAKPLLTYSAPSGTYTGEDAQNVTVDFWLSGPPLSESGNHVILTVDGKERRLSEWRPVQLVGLADGPHVITMDLRNARGQPIDNAFNYTQRTFFIHVGDSASESVPATSPASSW
jgi:hypothetical protein